MAKTAEKVNEGLQYFSKSDIISADSFRNERDLLSAILKDTEEYTIEQVSKLVQEYQRGVIS